MVFISSCKKETASINFSTIASPVSTDIYKITKYNDTVFYACGGNNTLGFILKSIDEGNTWIVYKNFDFVVYDIQFTDSLNAFAVGHDLQFLKTTDGGINWSVTIPDDQNRPSTGYLSELYSIQMFNDTLGFACGGMDFNKGVIYKTSNGTHWSLTFKEHEMRSVMMETTQQGWASGYGVIYQTTNGGVDWIPSTASNDFFTSLCKAGSKSFSCGYEGGIYSCDENNADWKKSENKNTPFSAREHYNSITFYDYDNGIAIGNNGLISVTHDGGSSWQSSVTFDKTFLRSALLTSATEGIVVGDGGMIYRFTY